MTTIVILLGLAIVLGIAFVFWAGIPLPPAVVTILKIAVVLYLLFCIMHQAGCTLPIEYPQPH